MEPSMIDDESCEYQEESRFIQVIETVGNHTSPLIEHFDLTLTSLEDWACYHGRSLMEDLGNDGGDGGDGGVYERKMDDEADDEEECIRIGTPDVLRACAYMLGTDPASLGTLEGVAHYASCLDEGTLAPTLVEEGKIVLSPSGTSSDAGASRAFVTYFCDGSSPSQPYLYPYQTLTTVYLI